MRKMPVTVRFLLFLSFAAVQWVFPAAAASELDIYILATGDLHGHVKAVHGSISEKVSSFKRRYPQQVIWVDTGDTAQGSWQLNRRRGSGMMPLLAQAGCTLFVPGNHELEYGFEAFKKIVREFPCTVLAANLAAPELQDKIEPWHMVTVKGVKIAFIGMTVGSFAQTFPVPSTRLQMLPEAAALRRAAQQVRNAGAEVIVLLRHAGLYGGGANLAQLLKKVPEIDLVIGGHSHIAEPGRRVGRAWFVQPPAHGRGMAEIRLEFDRSERRVRQIWSQIAEFAETPEDEDVELMGPAPSAAELSENFPAQKMLDLTRSDLAFYLVSDPEEFQKLLRKNTPAVEDYFRVFPYFDAVITVEVTARELIDIMQDCTRYAFKRKQLLLTAGFRCDTARGKLRTISFMSSKDRYRLALTAFVAAGAGGKLPGIRRILQNRIDYAAAEQAPGIMDILLTQ